MEKQKFSIRKRIKSFKFAFYGIFTFFSTEHNARIHLVAALIAILLAFYFQISIVEWCFILLAIFIVIIIEMLNTSIELLADKITLERDPKIKTIKDIAAGAVLVAALFALTIAIIIFAPKILNLF